MALRTKRKAIGRLCAEPDVAVSCALLIETSTVEAQDSIFTE
jgi:hypothetical protein